MPRRILLVEDETTIALLIELMLTDLGHEVVEIAMQLPQALAAARTAEIDFAILDVNLNGESTYPVAEVLDQRGISLVFATGYGSLGLDVSFKDRSIIQKPFTTDDLQRAIDQVPAV